MKLTLFIIILCFCTAVHGQQKPLKVPETTYPLPDSTVKILTVKDMQLIVDQVRSKVQDKITLAEWDKLIGLINAIIERRKRELDKPMSKN